GMCMTEPEAGTDVLGMRTTAELQGDHYVLNGRKMFITNGAIDDNTLGDVFLVYAKTGGKISTFLVEKGMPGFTLGQRLHDKLGMRSSMTAELVFDHCLVPAGNLIGEEGASLQHMMRNLEIERVALAAMSLGIAMRCLETMVQYANTRHAFGVPLREHGQIQRYIGDSYAEFRAARSYVYDVARRLDLRSLGNRADADGAKLFAARVGKNIADRAIQVLGGYGYMGEYVVERLWRDAKLIEIGREDIQVFPISAASNQGVRELIFRAADILDAIPNEPLVEEVADKEERKVYRMTKQNEDDDIVIRRDNDTFIVESVSIERMVKRMNLSTHDALLRFDRIMRQRGVNDALRKKGAKDGHYVRIGDFEFEFVEHE
ncbi:MAG: Obg family GTPase CgtA, partial [Gorillibacterium sp.]|nr:Obg family GTPase CgtA [Gorillibacterium sp.]